MRPRPAVDRRPGTGLVRVTLLALLVWPTPLAAQIRVATPGFPLEPGQRAILCGPRLLDRSPAHPIRLIGSDEGVLRRMYSPSETLVVGGGRADGLAAGQIFLVRRPGLRRLQPPELRRRGRRVAGLRTLGVIRLQHVDERLSSAEVLEMCEGFVEGDYLEPYEAPRVPLAAADDTPPDYTRAGLVLFADPSRRAVGPGDMVVTDRGADAVRPGQAVTIYRPALEHGGPVRDIAWGVVMEVVEASSMVRIDRAREAVYSGDLVAPHAEP